MIEAPTIIPVKHIARQSSACRFVSFSSPGKACLFFVKMGSRPNGFLSLVCRVQSSCLSSGECGKTLTDTVAAVGRLLAMQVQFLSQPFSTGKPSFGHEYEVSKRSQQGRVGIRLSLQGPRPHTFFVP